MPVYEFTTPLHSTYARKRGEDEEGEEHRRQTNSAHNNHPGTRSRLANTPKEGIEQGRAV
eukprot:5042293-Pyramimonas_sp.AAC.1